MAKILVCVGDPEERGSIASALRLKGHGVMGNESIAADCDPKEVARDMVASKSDVAILDYVPNDAASVKMLQAVTDQSKAPRFIFILPADASISHVLMAVNEGAAAVLQKPVDTDRLANYIERALSGPGRFRHDLAQEAAATTELQRVERDCRNMRTQLAASRKLIYYLLSTPMSSQARSVMIVSDSSYQRDQLRRLMEEMDFHVITATRPEEALEKALAEKPRVVISDLEMEGMNGVEFCNELKIKRKFVPCYFVICTANSEKIDDVMAPGNGVDACVLKPSSQVDSMELAAAAAMGLLL